ncbi:hypothetical protein G3N99_00355 [Burkholderia sp. Ac-20392]|nr:hypothetical protein [Burkholderia sp. Ac-20392]
MTRIAISEIGAFGAGTTAVMLVLIDILPDPNIWEMNTFHTLEFQMPRLQREPPFERHAAAVQVDVRSKRKPATPKFCGLSVNTPSCITMSADRSMIGKLAVLTMRLDVDLRNVV